MPPLPPISLMSSELPRSGNLVEPDKLGDGTVRALLLVYAGKLGLRTPGSKGISKHRPRLYEVCY